MSDPLDRLFALACFGLFVAFVLAIRLDMVPPSEVSLALIAALIPVGLFLQPRRNRKAEAWLKAHNAITKKRNSGETPSTAVTKAWAKAHGKQIAPSDLSPSLPFHQPVGPSDRL